LFEQGAHRVQGITLHRLDHFDVGSGRHRDRTVSQNPLHGRRRYRVDGELRLEQVKTEASVAVAVHDAWCGSTAITARFFAGLDTRRHQTSHSIQLESKQGTPTFGNASLSSPTVRGAVVTGPASQ
jgi:hypothetical protein